MDVWTLVTEDGELVRVYRELEDLFASMGIEDTYTEWQGLFGPPEDGTTTAWPPMFESPYYGDRWFVRQWNPISETYDMFLAVREHVYVYGDDGANEGATYKETAPIIPCANCSIPVEVSLEWRHVGEGCDNAEPDYPEGF